VPVLSALQQVGLVEPLLAGAVRVENCQDIKNPHLLKSSLTYLASINVLHESNGSFSLTDFGRKMLPRNGSASILESYAAHFDELSSNLQRIPSEYIGEVDRSLNILGSGGMHATKFFNPGLDFVSQSAPKTWVDLGCGNGTFLAKAAQRLETITNLLAVDLSPTSTDTSQTYLEKKFPAIKVNSKVSDAKDVQKWAAELTGRDKTVISAWFVIHEFCEGKVSKVIEFFNDVWNISPRSEILIGELVKADSKVLAENRSQTIMPEFLFFHACSGQMPLTWSEWNEIRNSIPYDIKSEKLFDVIGEGALPSNFIWHMTPR
jgi:SAM-dependent methyltransferase